MEVFEGEGCKRGLEEREFFKLKKDEEERKRRTKICGHGTCQGQYGTRRLDRFQSRWVMAR